MSAVLGGRVLREIPAKFLAGVESGELKVFGSVIRSQLTNRFVGHLQETSGLSKMVGLAMAPVNPIGAAVSAVELIGQGVVYSQNRAILNAVKTIEQLQIASLAVGVVGIGVSIAGTAYSNLRPTSSGVADTVNSMPAS